jgi:hypothetical protein
MAAALAFAVVFVFASWARAPEARSEAGVAASHPAATADGPAEPARAERRRRGRPIYWGAWIGEQLTGEQPPWDMGAVHKFERIAGKRLSLIEFAAPFAECYSSSCNFYDFPATEMQKVRRHGAIPFFSWSSQSIPGKVREPAFQLSDVIRGRFDRYIRGWARAAKRWGHPFFLRFNWEMNGNWFPWGVGVNGNRRPQFVRAWRHVHRIFSRVGARNATWVWCPFVDPEGRDNLRAFYPGGRFVDWTCLDAYNWGRGNPALSRPWRSFGELFRSSYRRIVRRIARRKPMIIGEVASSDYGGSKAAWIRNMLAKVPRRYPKIRGLIWFNADDRGANWQIESSRSSRRAFRRGISRGVYRPNRFGRIHRNPIRPARGRR